MRIGLIEKQSITKKFFEFFLEFIKNCLFEIIVCLKVVCDVFGKILLKVKIILS